MPNGQSRWIVAALAAGTWGLGGCDAATVGGGSAVRVYEGTRVIRTGPFLLKGPSPQQRPNDYRPFTYPAVFIENEYFRCCVLPTVGGRLYEVYNKPSKSQVFFVNPYLDAHADNYEGGHPWNLGGVEVNFPYFHHGNSYNDRWQWTPVHDVDGSAGVAMAFTSRPSMQRAGFRVTLRPGVARVFLSYRFENMNPYPWGLAAWIDTMHPKTMDTEFILPSPWVAQHGYNRNRTDLKPWPVRDGVDLSWQKNVKPGGDLSEFAFMPREHFHGCYDHAADRGAARIFDPATLPAAKLWTQAAPVKPEQYYQHFEIWTATSAVMEDPRRQAELSSYAAADSWQQVWGIGGYVFANGELALNLVRQADGKLLAGVCVTRPLPGSVVSLREGPDTFFRHVVDLDPAKPFKRLLPARAGNIIMEVVSADAETLASYELLKPDTEVPREQWQMPTKGRWAEGVEAAYYDEDYAILWRRPDCFLDGAIGRYQQLLKADPNSAELMFDLGRTFLKDQQIRIGEQYRRPGPAAEADAAKRRQADLAQAVKLLGESLKLDPTNARAHLYLGLALERQGKRPQAAQAYAAALASTEPAPAAGLWAARLMVADAPAEAVRLLRDAAAAYPQSNLAAHMLMAALTAAGQCDQAVAIGKRLLAADPANPLTCRLIADALAKAGRTGDAEKYAAETRRLLAGDEKATAGIKADLRFLAGK